MRNSVELAEDLSNLSSVDWNIKLAEEYNIPYDEFVSAVNSYAYNASSEDAIHSRMKPIHLVKPNEKQRSKTEPLEPVDATPKNNNVNNLDPATKISTIVRNFGALFVEQGDIITQKLLCGLICEDSLLSNILIKASVFNNCVFTNSDFACCRIIQSKFIDCDFTGADFRGAIISKSQFYECVFNEAQWAQISMSDVILYKCQIQHTDADDSNFTTFTMHDCDFSNTHLKRTKMLGGVISYSFFNNTILNDAELYDTNLISIDLSQSELRGIVMCDCPSTSLKIDSIYAEQFGIATEELDEFDNFSDPNLEDNLESDDDDDGEEQDA